MTRTESPTGTAAGYPKRPSHFAHKYTRLLTKTCAANEITALGCWLCTVIAHLEDSRRYTGPISFYNEQLAPLLGVKKWETLERARRLAVDHGWLAYQCGGRHKPGYYHVTIPPGLEGLDDAPCDESSYPKNGYLEGDQGESRYPKNGYNRGISADTTGEQEGGSFLPSPVPVPVPKEESAAADEPLILERQLIVAWNAARGVRHTKGAALTDARREAFRTRLKTEGWLQDALEAIAKFPVKCQLDAAGNILPDAWLPTMDWFLKPDSVPKVLEGKYDWSKASGNGKAPMRVGPSHRHPEDAKTDRWGAKPK